jgi:hypothetical protein
MLDKLREKTKSILFCERYSKKEFLSMQKSLKDIEMHKNYENFNIDEFIEHLRILSNRKDVKLKKYNIFMYKQGVIKYNEILIQRPLTNKEKDMFLEGLYGVTETGYNYLGIGVKL